MKYTPIFEELARKHLMDLQKKDLQIICSNLSIHIGSQQKSHVIQKLIQYILENFEIKRLQISENPILFNILKDYQDSNVDPNFQLEDPNIELLQEHQLETCICSQNFKYFAYLNTEQDFREIQCIICEESYHRFCVKSDSNFECPKCAIQKMDFYHDPVVPLSQPIILSQNFKNIQISFDLSSDFQKVQDEFWLEIRCVRVQPKLMMECTWPDACELLINGSKVQEFLPLQKNSSLKKRKDQNFLTKDLVMGNFFISGQNVIKVNKQLTINKNNYKINEDSSHMLQVFLIKKLSSDFLIQQIKSKEFPNFDQSKKVFFDQMKNQETIQVSLTLSLKDEISFNRIQTPVRGKNCKHVKVFSLETVIKMLENGNPRKFQCPSCHTPLHELVVDRYIESIIKTIPDEKDSEQITDIIFHHDESYEFKRTIIDETFNQSEDSVAEKIKKNVSKEVQVIEISDEDSEQNKQSKTVQKNISYNIQQNVPYLDQQNQNSHSLNNIFQNNQVQNNNNQQNGLKQVSSIEPKIVNQVQEQVQELNQMSQNPKPEQILPIQNQKKTPINKNSIIIIDSDEEVPAPKAQNQPMKQNIQQMNPNQIKQQQIKGKPLITEKQQFLTQKEFPIQKPQTLESLTNMIPMQHQMMPFDQKNQLFQMNPIINQMNFSMPWQHLIYPNNLSQMNPSIMPIHFHNQQFRPPIPPSSPKKVKKFQAKDSSFTKPQKDKKAILEEEKLQKQQKNQIIEQEMKARIQLELMQQQEMQSRIQKQTPAISKVEPICYKEIGKFKKESEGEGILLKDTFKSENIFYKLFENQFKTIKFKSQGYKDPDEPKIKKNILDNQRKVVEKKVDFIPVQDGSNSSNIIANQQPIVIED